MLEGYATFHVRPFNDLLRLLSVTQLSFSEKFSYHSNHQLSCLFCLC